MRCSKLGCQVTAPHWHDAGLRDLYFPKISELPKVVSSDTDQRDTTLPTDSQERKDIPMMTGFIDYFPAAVAEVARLSKTGNDKHNSGEELHWARGKSSDHADTILRHQSERGTKDTDGHWHDTKVAWRAMAQLQELLEQHGAPLSRASRKPEKSDV